MNQEVNWEDISINYPIGNLIIGIVEHHAHFGIFLNIGHPVVKGLVLIMEFMDEGIMKPELYPLIGTEVRGVILGYTDYNNQIKISLKPSRLQVENNPDA